MLVRRLSFEEGKAFFLFRFLPPAVMKKNKPLVLVRPPEKTRVRGLPPLGKNPGVAHTVSRGHVGGPSAGARLYGDR